MSRLSKWVAVTIVATASMTISLSVAASEIVVYKTPSCGCCEKWVQHVRESGFTAVVHNVAETASIRTKHGVPVALASCHTATVGGYVLEGHVPAADIKRLLHENPKVTGLAVPAMPPGAPGMGSAGQPFDTLSFDRSGKTAIYSRH